jgi:F-type H+-transporting ATPase subunit b
VTTVTLAAEGGGNDIFLLPNSTFVVCLLIFVGMFLIFHRFIVPPLAKAMREREAMLKKQAEDRAEAAKRLEQAKERYESSLAEARAESTRIKDEARADAEKIRQQMRTETDEEVARIRAEGLAQLEEQRTAALGTLRGEIGGLSTDLAGRILGSPMGADGPQKSTIEAYLAELDQKQSVGGKS